MAACRQSDAPPPAFARAVAQLRAAALRPEVSWEEAPAPQRVAPYSAAVTADVLVEDQELATGRLVLLHDPSGHDAWRGTFRCVAYLRAEIEPDLVTDALLGHVAWSWLAECLDRHEAAYVEPSGTVTKVASESFGGMAGDPTKAELELRASWTPADEHLGHHLEGWGDLLCTAAGLPPVPAGVVPLAQRRART